MMEVLGRGGRLRRQGGDNEGGRRSQPAQGRFFLLEVESKEAHTRNCFESAPSTTLDEKTLRLQCYSQRIVATWIEIKALVE